MRVDLKIQPKRIALTFAFGMAMVIVGHVATAMSLGLPNIFTGWLPW